MDLSASLLIMQKGIEEITDRTFKLDLKARNILFLLAKGPRTIDEVINKSLFDQAEVMERIEALVNKGFVSTTGAVANLSASEGRATITRPASAANTNDLYLKDGIIISEAKFLLTNYCLDTFGTKAQELIDPLNDIRSVKNIQFCLRNIFDATSKKYPAHMPALLAVIKEINESSD